VTEEHSFALAGADPRLAGGRLTINLHSLVANYRALQHLSAPASVAGVLKADAYGLGVEFVAPALLKAGCRHFFVALPEEGRHLRNFAPDTAIFVLAGLFEAEAAPFFSESRLIPVLNTEREIAIWEAHCGSAGEALPCAIHVDTGMNRLGLSVEQAIAFAEDNALTEAVKPILLISHFAAADTPLNPLNRKQIEAFQRVRQSFPP
jgi:alanine racemase